LHVFSLWDFQWKIFSIDFAAKPLFKADFGDKSHAC